MIIMLILFTLFFVFVVLPPICTVLYKHYDKKADDLRTKANDVLYDCISADDKEEIESLKNEERLLRNEKDKAYKKRNLFADFSIDGGDDYAYILAVVVLTTVIVVGCILPILLTHGSHGLIEYRQTLTEKEALERDYQAYIDGTTYDTTDIHARIAEFNNNLREDKYWANNPWTSWYRNPMVRDIDFIEWR